MISSLKLSTFLYPTSSRFFIRQRLLSSASPKRSLNELSTDRAKNEKWKLMVSVCLERFPIIAPAPTELELKYRKMLREIEDEKSLLSHHELRHLEDRRLAKKGKSKSLIQTDDHQIITAQDFEDASVAERKQFVASPRSSADDSKLDSLNRLLDRKLIFLIPADFGDKNFWDLPITALEEGETLIQAAERILTQTVDISSGATFYGNAPRKLYKYKFPKPVREETGAVGGKIFMFKAELPRHAKVTPRVQNFRWLTQEELGSAIKSRKYRLCVSSFIFE